MAKTKSSAKEESLLVSFKLGKTVFDELCQYSKNQVDESGLKMSPSQVARKLMIESLSRYRAKK